MGRWGSYGIHSHLEEGLYWLYIVCDGIIHFSYFSASICVSSIYIPFWTHTSLFQEVNTPNAPFANNILSITHANIVHWLALKQDKCCFFFFFNRLVRLLHYVFIFSFHCVTASFWKHTSVFFFFFRSNPRVQFDIHRKLF